MDAYLFDLCVVSTLFKVRQKKKKRTENISDPKPVEGYNSCYASSRSNFNNDKKKPNNKHLNKEHCV